MKPITPLIRSLYRSLLESVHKTPTDDRGATADKAIMLVFADALEDDLEEIELAAAYRWAAHNGKWPFRRRRSKLLPDHLTVYDWDRIGRANKSPETARIPRPLFDCICSMPDDTKRYGGINRAFVLLARALVETEGQSPTDPPGVTVTLVPPSQSPTAD
jgi:hypothetical protein